MSKLRGFGFLLLFLGTSAVPAAIVSAAPAPIDCGVLVDSWITDTEFNPLDCDFKVLTDRDGCVITTNPGGFYYNILVEALNDIPDLEIAATIPADFSLWGNNPVHVYINTFDINGPDDNDAVYAGDDLSFGPVAVSAGDQIFMTIHVRYTAGCISEGYLPKTYTFSALVTGTGFSESTSASITGVLKK